MVKYHLDVFDLFFALHQPTWTVTHLALDANHFANSLCNHCSCLLAAGHVVYCH